MKAHNKMKTSLKILTGVMALSAATLAEAQTTIKVTGSTAFRNGFMLAVEHLMVSYSGAYFTGDGSTSLEGANLSVLHGNISGLGDCIVQCCWAGSVGGIQVLDQNLLPALPANATHPWLKASLAAFPATAVSDTSAASYDADATADASMSDSFQSSTPFNGNVLADRVVGVVPFKWIANNGAPAGLSNATPKLVQALLAGPMRLSLWTGNPSDSSQGVYAVGRNFDSGTRLTTYAESGFGINSSPQQYKVNVSAGAVTSILLYPAETVLGTDYGDGESGYASGSSVSTAVKATTTAGFTGGKPGLTGGYLVSYMGRKDAQGAITAGAKELTWSGFPDTDTAIEQGQYTFWGYEHLMYRSTLVGPQLTLAGRIATQLHDVDAAAGSGGALQNWGILLNNMAVGRQTDGGNVSYGARYTTVY